MSRYLVYPDYMLWFGLGFTLPGSKKAEFGQMRLTHSPVPSDRPVGVQRATLDDPIDQEIQRLRMLWMILSWQRPVPPTYLQVEIQWRAPYGG